mmetsp:Transcript_12843/g.28514  ORF Transcript_12843/g.28514 Transcript_12843/m.28514 type:complete len:222 (-) Transcript_12843:1032-1697(-)
MAPLKKSRQPLPDEAVPQISSITSTMPSTRPPPASRTGRCRYFWSCISRRASSTVRSPDTQSGFAVITSDTKVELGSLPLAITRFSTSLGVRMPSSVCACITNTPLRVSAISWDASATDAVGSTLHTLPPADPGDCAMMLRSVGTDPPNMCSISACIAASCAVFADRPPAAAFIAAVIAWAIAAPASAPDAPAPDPDPDADADPDPPPSSPCTFSSTEIAS